MDEFDRIWRLMDEFMEGGMDMEEEFYRDLFHTMRKTVELCHNMECCQVPKNLHVLLIQVIEKTPQTKSSKRRNPPRP